MKQLISFARRLLDNIGVKLVAVVVAMIIWFTASGQQNVKRNYVATLTYVNIADSLTIMGRYPTEVDLSIAGTRRELLFLSFRKISMMVNLARAEPGRYNQRLAVSDVILPAGIELGDVRIVGGFMVDLIIERLVTKRVRVEVVFDGELAPEQLFDRDPRARPGWVMVTGPQSAVDPIELVPTKRMDLTRIRETVTREVELDYDSELFDCEPKWVTVDISISNRRQRVIANLPPTVLVDDDNLRVEVTPKTVSLTLEGPEALIDTLAMGDISVLIDLSGKPPGHYVLAPEIIVPEGIHKIDVDVDSLQITVTRVPGGRSM